MQSCYSSSPIVAGSNLMTLRFEYLNHQPSPDPAWFSEENVQAKSSVVNNMAGRCVAALRNCL